MSIQRFHAPTAREALALARATFGDGTLILSNRQLPDGVEVTAASEETLSALDAAQDHAPRTTASPAPVAARPAAKAVAASVAALAGAAAAATATTSSIATRETVQADTEQLAMSTLSFQDYVRERMLRRQSEGRVAPTPDLMDPPPAAPAAPVPLSLRAPAPSPAPVPAPAPSTPAARNVQAKVAAPIAAPIAVSVVEDSFDFDELPEPIDVTIAAEPEDVLHTAAHVETAPAATPLAIAPASSAAAPEASGNVMAELHAMKALMEDRFNVLAWLGQARHDPIHSNLMLKLVRAGYSPALARTVLEPITMAQEASATVREVMTSLEGMLLTDAAGPSLAEEGGVFALIGATGVGKTTTIAKLAAQCASIHGPSAVGLLTLDVHRAGAHEQLRSYAKNIGVVAHLAHDRAALQELLELLSMKKIVLIDTAGIAPRDPRRNELLDMLDLPGLKQLLVLNAGAHGDTLDDIASRFKGTGTNTRQAIITKIDETVKLGPAIDTVIRHKLVLRGVANGQRVPQDWKAADAAELVRNSMRSAERSPFDPRTADLDYYFSPAACAA